MTPPDSTHRDHVHGAFRVVLVDRKGAQRATSGATPEPPVTDAQSPPQSTARHPSGRAPSGRLPAPSSFPFPESPPAAEDVVDLHSLQKCVEALDDRLFRDDDTELAACPFWGTANNNGAVPDLIPSGNLLQVRGCMCGCSCDCDQRLWV